jgi:hypothetical protein
MSFVYAPAVVTVAAAKGRLAMNIPSRQRLPGVGATSLRCWSGYPSSTRRVLKLVGCAAPPGCSVARNRVDYARNVYRDDRMVVPIGSLNDMFIPLRERRWYYLQDVGIGGPLNLVINLMAILLEDRPRFSCMHCFAAKDRSDWTWTVDARPLLNP